MVYIYIILIVLNAFLYRYMDSVRSKWMEQAGWLIAQMKFLQEHKEFQEEAVDAQNTGLKITEWAMELIKFTIFILIPVQLVIWMSLLNLVLLGESYIPSEIVAFGQAGVLVYTYTIYKRWHQSRGDCLGVNANVIAAKIYMDDMESMDEDGGRDSADPNDSQ